jgi:predicted lipid-binding transport protein (Tim44 family)
VSAHAQAERAAELDTEYWSDIGCGQDTEEAEHSGWLEGVRDALDACVAAFGRGDVEGLARFAGQLREFGNTSQDKLDYARQDDVAEADLDDDGTAITVRVTVGASEALLNALRGQV